MLQVVTTVIKSGVFAGLCWAATATAVGQNLYQDYHVNRTGVYSPSDPWVKGHVFRTHTGHDGLFYNCDGEEDKRCSPYIRWSQRPCDDLLSLKRVHQERVQTIHNAINRVQMGSCREGCNTWGNQYPPGAGYGTAPAERNATDPALNGLESPPGQLMPQPENLMEPAGPAPEPQPSLELGRSRSSTGVKIVDLPGINHLRRVPR